MDRNELTHHGIKGMKWGVRRFQNKDGSLTKAGRRRYAEENAHEDYKKAHDDKDVRLMSDKELRERNNRLQAERQYQNMTKKTSKGKKVVTAVIATGITVGSLVTAYENFGKAGKKIAGTAVGKAGINAGKAAGNKALDKIGDWVVSGIDMSGPLTTDAPIRALTR